MIADTSALIAILRDAPNSYRTSSVTSQNLPEAFGRRPEGLQQF
jgi:hypothetical protein